MDLGDCHNTFFDEYDTYVREEKVSINQSTASLENQDNHTLTTLFFSYYSSDNSHAVSFKHKYSSYLNYNPPKLFLRNSVWRI